MIDLISYAKGVFDSVKDTPFASIWLRSNSDLPSEIEPKNINDIMEYLLKRIFYGS